MCATNGRTWHGTGWTLRNVATTRCVLRQTVGHSLVHARFAVSTQQGRTLTFGIGRAGRETRRAGVGDFIPAAIHVSLRSPHSVHDRACVFPVFCELSRHTRQWTFSVHRTATVHRAERLGTPLSNREGAGILDLRGCTIATNIAHRGFTVIFIFLSIFFPQSRKISLHVDSFVSNDVGDAVVYIFFCSIAHETASFMRVRVPLRRASSDRSYVAYTFSRRLSFIVARSRVRHGNAHLSMSDGGCLRETRPIETLERQRDANASSI